MERPDRGLMGKVALIAGGGGIGGETARRLAAEGCKVMIGDLFAEAAEATAQSIRESGGVCAAHGYDQADDASVETLIQATLREYGTIDFLLANAADMAALTQDSDLLAIDMAIFDRTMAVGMRGIVMCARLALPHILANRGAMVFMSSGAAHAGEAQRFSYAMAKSAMNALMRHIARRWGPEGVRANAILPGLVLSEQVKERMSKDVIAQMKCGIPCGRLGEPSDIAAMVAMLFSRDGEWISGQTLSVDGGSSMRP
jgi:NAD(P)-dependent dehydrogenase (short-subunit alcohol dehydrogenase family)